MPTVANSDSPIAPKLDEKKIFEVHLEALKEAYKELIDANQKIAGILLVVIGWFAGKDNPLTMLCHVPYMVYFALGCTVAGFFALAYLFNVVYERGQASYEVLCDLGYESALFARFKVSRGMYWCGLFGQFTLLVGVFSLLAVKYLLVFPKTCGV
ncbi:hypothetical protein [Ideonella paludis]|uniref:Uncharacterized protein n=1 Tax=Ideonella paludis TaxID=1233411 RepID=A0ABS5DXP4_9BURK|nr:hypothetical protein [Ideonella paludis]MBQ0935915.1 hypothetical protein [Ideonella paludis]